MSENNRNPLNSENDEMEDDLIVFETEDGQEVTFLVEDYFFYNGDEYAILSEYDTEKDEIVDNGNIVCRIETSPDENGEEGEEFIPVEDEELAEKLIEIANAQLEDDGQTEE